MLAAEHARLQVLQAMVWPAAAAGGCWLMLLLGLALLLQALLLLGLAVLLQAVLMLLLHVNCLLHLGTKAAAAQPGHVVMIVEILFL